MQIMRKIYELGKKKELFGSRKSRSSEYDEPSYYVILNSDDTLLTPKLRTWVLKCAFAEQDLNELATELMASAPTSTVREFNEWLLHLASSPLDRAAPDLQRNLQFRAAVFSHLLRLSRNEKAYHPARVGAGDSGFWPDPTNARNGRSLLTELPYVKAHKFITRSTPVSSAGSCFAMEIAHQLQADGFNYVIAERNHAGGSALGEDAPVDASAAWGIIFNTPSFRQLVERAFGLRELPKILWSGQTSEGGRELYMDPFREGIEFETPEGFLAEYAAHQLAARTALLQAKVFIITLGLNEVWTFRMDD